MRQELLTSKGPSLGDLGRALVAIGQGPIDTLGLVDPYAKPATITSEVSIFSYQQNNYYILVSLKFGQYSSIKTNPNLSFFSKCR